MKLPMQSKSFLAVVATAAITISGSVSFAQSMCDDYWKSLERPESVIPSKTKFHPVQLEANLLSREIKSTRDPRFNQERLNLLKMLSDTVFISSDRKTTIEKGELRLGHVISDNLSLEFEYVGDKRGAETAYRLTRIRLVKPNGQDVTIDKNPVSDDGLSLNRNSFLFSESSKEIKQVEKEDFEGWLKDDSLLKYSLGSGKKVQPLDFLLKNSKDLGVRDRQVLNQMLRERETVRVPVVIEGVLLTELLRWSDRLQYLERSEIREAVSGDRIGSLKWTSIRRANMKFMSNVARKQVFKYALIMSVFYGVMNYDKLIPGDSGWVQLDNPMMTAEQRKLVQELIQDAEGQAKTLNSLLDSKLEEQAVDVLTVRQKIKQSAWVEKTVVDFIEREVSAKGRVRFYLGEGSKKKAGFLIGEFAKSQRIVVIPMTKESEKLPHLLSLLVVDRVEQPTLYDTFSKALDRLESQTAQSDDEEE